MFTNHCSPYKNQDDICDCLYTIEYMCVSYVRIINIIIQCKKTSAKIMIQNKGQDVVVLLQCVHSCIIRIIREIKTFVNVFVSFFTNGCFEPDENGNTVPPARCTRGSGSAVGERVTGGDIHCS